MLYIFLCVGLLSVGAVSIPTWGCRNQYDQEWCSCDNVKKITILTTEKLFIYTLSRIVVQITYFDVLNHSAFKEGTP